MELFLCVLKWGLVVGAAALILRLLRPVLDRRYRARWRTWTWLILACALILGPGAERLLAARPIFSTPPVVIQVPQMDVQWQADRDAGVRLRVLPSGAPQSAPASPAAGPGDAAVPRPASAKTLPIETLFPAVWLAGAALFLLWRLLGTLLFCRRARRWSRQPGEQTRQFYRSACDDLHIQRPPILLISAPVGSPMMTGLLRPRLYLPSEDWGPQELAFILCHELTHYRRHDLWYKLLILAANALHWFNPLIYLLSREADTDLELTCDDAVVAGRGREDRQAYSETLLGSLHRQRGLSRAALSTHFYGGAKIMKERFRNILTQNKRKFGVTALLLALLLTSCAAATLGIRQQAGTEPAPDAEQETEQETERDDAAYWKPAALTAEEMADWEERLNSTELNGFVSRMYSDIRYLPLGELFYNHMGDPLTDSERAAYREAWGDDPPGLDISAVTRREAEDFLAEHTGLTLSDFPGGLDAQWNYSQEGDRWYFFHGDTNFTPVTVTGGVRQADSLTLYLEARDGQFSSGLASGELTLIDGKFFSFTTPLYTQAEALARGKMNSAFAWMEEDYGVTFTDRCLTDLWCVASETIGEESYSAWAMTYLLKPEDISKVPLAGEMETFNGWLTQSDGPGDPIAIVSVRDGQVQLCEWTDTSVSWEMGYTWEEWITAHSHLGMNLSAKLNGWPEVTTEFIASIAAGKEEWCTSWETTAERCLRQKGRTPEDGGLTIEKTFQSGYDGDQSLLIRAVCAEGGYLLFLNRQEYFYGAEGQSSVVFWQVLGEVPAGEPA